jgi:hypothetical protein
MRRRLDGLGLGGMHGITVGSDTSSLLLGHNQRFGKITVGNTGSHAS